MTDADAQFFSNYQWQNRLLLIQVPSQPTKAFQKQLNELKMNQEGLRDRKLILFFLKGKTFKKGIFEHSEWQNIPDLGEVSVFHTTSNFEMVLIGLDGGIKLRKKDFLPMEDLFSTIDAMPMRIQEMRNKN